MDLSLHLAPIPMPMFFILLGIAGLYVGSFINVVIHRLPIMIEQANYPVLDREGQLAVENKKLNLWQPRSFCTSCNTTISLWSNIPVIGYLALRGTARCCGKKIPQRYLWIELLMGCLGIALGYQFGYSIVLIFAFILTAALVALVFIDIDTLLLPDLLTLPTLWLGLFGNLFFLFTPLSNAVLGAIGGYLFFYLIALLALKIRKIHCLGQGDFKLLAMLGAWFGVHMLPTIIFIASCTGLLVGSILIFSLKQTLTFRLPFGPFLALAGLLVLFWGPAIYKYQMNILPII